MRAGGNCATAPLFARGKWSTCLAAISEPRSAAHLLTRDEARRIAAHIASCRSCWAESSSRNQLVEQRLRLLQIARIEALSEPARPEGAFKNDTHTQATATAAPPSRRMTIASTLAAEQAAGITNQLTPDEAEDSLGCSSIPTVVPF